MDSTVEIGEEYSYSLAAEASKEADDDLLCEICDPMSIWGMALPGPDEEHGEAAPPEGPPLPPPATHNSAEPEWEEADEHPEDDPQLSRVQACAR